MQSINIGIRLQYTTLIPTLAVFNQEKTNGTSSFLCLLLG